MRCLVSLFAIVVVMQLSVLGARAQSVDGVYVNLVPLTDDDLQALALVYGDAPPPGLYWYDPVSGLWGGWGEPPSARIQEGLPFAGALSLDASAGASGVFINGRQIGGRELAFLSDALGTVGAGWYTLDARRAQEIYSPLWAAAPSPVSPSAPAPVNPSAPAPVNPSAPAPVNPPAPASVNCGQSHYGPYATMRRANEVAGELQRRGFATVPYHNGDGYYVNAKDARCVQ